jgi:D-glycero-D-manno-heptose 1,7-bisphosphate phosphatase
MKKALFLDRDGVVNKEKGHLYKIEDFEFIDGIFEICREFKNRDYLIIVITNQAGIARGKYTEEDYKTLTQWMLERFLEKGIKIDAVYHCPHHPDFKSVCECRKPSPGMLKKAQENFDIDMKSSVLVGDKESDIEAGLLAGVGKKILIRNEKEVDEERTKADEIVESVKGLSMIYSRGR